MGCGCKISEPVVVGAYVDHSECRFAQLEKDLAKQKEYNKSGAEWAFKQINDLRQEVSRLTRERDKLKDALVGAVEVLDENVKPLATTERLKTLLRELNETNGKLP